MFSRPPICRSRWATKRCCPPYRPRAPGDIQAGETLYKRECRGCHGKRGQGDAPVPMLAGQYTNYLWRQVDKYLRGERIHDEEAPREELLAEFTRTELQDIFAYLSIVDD